MLRNCIALFLISSALHSQSMVPASKKELNELTGTYIIKGEFTQSNPSVISLSTGEFPIEMDMMVLDVAQPPMERPGYINFFANWSGALVGGVRKFGNQYEFSVVTLDIDHPLVYKLKIKRIESNLIEIELFSSVGQKLDLGIFGGPLSKRPQIPSNGDN